MPVGGSLLVWPSRRAGARSGVKHMVVKGLEQAPTLHLVNPRLQILEPPIPGAYREKKAGDYEASPARPHVKQPCCSASQEANYSRQPGKGGGGLLVGPGHGLGFYSAGFEGDSMAAGPSGFGNPRVTEGEVGFEVGASSHEESAG